MASKARATRVTSKTGYHHGDLREQLVRAARRLVARDGAARFKVVDACRLAGVSTAAPYRHFADRQAILDAVATDGFARLARAMRAATEGHRTGSLEALTAIGIVYVDFARDEPHVFRLMFGSPHTTQTRDAADWTPVDELEKSGSAAYDVLLGQIAAHLERDPDDVAVLKTGLSMWMMVHGLSFLLVDEQLGVGRLELDVKAMVNACGAKLLEAFVEA